MKGGCEICRPTASRVVYGYFVAIYHQLFPGYSNLSFFWIYAESLMGQKYTTLAPRAGPMTTGYLWICGPWDIHFSSNSILPPLNYNIDIIMKKHDER